MLIKLLCGVLVGLLTSGTAIVQAQSVKASPVLALQVQLDQAGFSPGQIDGRGGANTTKALAAYTRAHNKAPGDGGADTLSAYTITADDAAGPFVRIPADMMDKAKLKKLGYTTLLEALGERFHSSPSLLQALNPGARFGAGIRITVPNVERAKASTGDGSASVVAARVVVSKSASSLTVFDASGALLFYAPVTSGSARDPLPLGEWTVTGVSRNPVFNYNPDLFWDADAAQAKAKIPAGPNGPVGVVWIDISKEHYGIHGSPEPSRIGHSDSHGCVRLTNWDASRVADLVKKGTPVQFVE